MTIGLGAPLHDACATPRLTRRRFAPRSLATVQASAPGTRREVVFPTGNGALQSLSQSAAPVGWVNGPSPSEIGDSEDSQQLFVARGTGSMCDYSLHRVASRSAKVGDMLACPVEGEPTPATKTESTGRPKMPGGLWGWSASSF